VSRGTPGRAGQCPRYQGVTARDPRPGVWDSRDTCVPAVPGRPRVVCRHNCLIAGLPPRCPVCPTSRRPDNNCAISPAAGLIAGDKMFHYWRVSEIMAQIPRRSLARPEINADSSLIRVGDKARYRVLGIH